MGGSALKSVVSAHAYGILVQFLGMARSIYRDGLFQAADIQNKSMGIGLETSHGSFNTTESRALNFLFGMPDRRSSDIPYLHRM